MVEILDQIRNCVRQMAMVVANIPGHKVLFVGGSAHDWNVDLLYDQYVTLSLIHISEPTRLDVI
eukprot:12749005-Prorocentrum_lima.AAC.1